MPDADDTSSGLSTTVIIVIVAVAVVVVVGITTLVCILRRRRRLQRAGPTKDDHESATHPAASLTHLGTANASQSNLHLVTHDHAAAPPPVHDDPTSPAAAAPPAEPANDDDDDRSSTHTESASDLDPRRITAWSVPLSDLDVLATHGYSAATLTTALAQHAQRSKSLGKMLVRHATRRGQLESVTAAAVRDVAALLPTATARRRLRTAWTAAELAAYLGGRIALRVVTTLKDQSPVTKPRPGSGGGFDDVPAGAASIARADLLVFHRATAESESGGVLPDRWAEVLDPLHAAVLADLDGLGVPVKPSAETAVRALAVHAVYVHLVHTVVNRQWELRFGTPGEMFDTRRMVREARLVSDESGSEVSAGTDRLRVAFAVAPGIDEPWGSTGEALVKMHVVCYDEVV
ncbi:hypothetical protein AMAG_13266 [Allomyces macrogynus ATCC 38327]|uniref:Uncharacterized protein n=1 Tax=Allomyces macrogynus (strain ATCC 38327) TaxID=578462 RepID=A0A0L0T024_ALLM3|nr:hypothetical protein AMAG_13266 [Allomyces macrogynus ATCC 38327]|eukprot:KNE68097.1 hypothetical protein AMAG_13266 [Allomyces macrogynus ATCC 38327]